MFVDCHRLASETEVCFDENLVECPSQLQVEFRKKLSKLMSYVNVECGVDPCIDNPCQNGGECSVDPNSIYNFNCTCSEGWTGDFCQYGRKSTDFFLWTLLTTYNCCNTLFDWIMMITKINNKKRSYCRGTSSPPLIYNPVIWYHDDQKLFCSHRDY